jgi:hypothetical protein
MPLLFFNKQTLHIKPITHTTTTLSQIEGFYLNLPTSSAKIKKSYLSRGPELTVRYFFSVRGASIAATG